MQSDDDGTISAVNDSGIPVCLGRSSQITARLEKEAMLL